MLTMIFLLVLSSLCVVKIIIQGLYLIHKLQQYGYKNQKLIKWLEGQKYRVILVWNLFELFIPLLVILVFYFWKDNDLSLYKTLTGLIMLLVFAWKIIHPFIAGWIGPKAVVKKPLVYTARVKRLIFSLFMVALFAVLLMIRFTAYPVDEFSLNSWRFFQFNAFLLLFSVITPIFVLISNFIVAPFEKLVHGWFYLKAKIKLSRSSIERIGVTGSFGKTSTKFFLTTVLSEKYKTITSPSSFNTPMGLSKVINESKLDDYQYFVAEMGADHVGDIKYLANLVKPSFGIITAVGPQHLETFGTPENVLKTKLELFDSLPENGFGVYNYDSLMLRDAIINRNYNFKLYSYSSDPANMSMVDIWADSIKHTRAGLEFTACFRDGGVLDVKTELLGRHNVLNLLAVILTAKLCGMTSDEILRGVLKIKSVEHRLQRIDPGTGVLVLDDAFNSNYTGAIEAVNVLNEIGGANKIIVTPGFVELGDEEDRYNKMFGEYMAGKVTHAILVGVQKTNSIKDGLLNGSMCYDKIFTVNTLEEAQKVLSKILSPGDIVLFENDLPDTYSEV